MEYTIGKVQQDNTSKKPRYYCVITKKTFYDAKVVYGSTPEIAKRKAEKALRVFMREDDAMKIEIIDHGAVAKNRLPLRAKPMDAGADVFAPRTWVLGANQTEKIPLGFGLKIPNGFTGFVFPRSNLSARGIVCQLPPIDPSYTGEIHAVVTNMGAETYHIKEGDRIGQLVILPCVIADFVTEPLEARGGEGFGSTGR